MPRRKIPQDAFSFYFGIGPGRSYQKVAAKYDVTKRAVTKLAAKEGWQARLNELERKARQSANTKALDSLEAMNDRHLKAVRVVQGKALEALREIPLDKAISAVRALESAIRQERVILGEPGDRTAVDMEERIRGEYERWMTVDGGCADGREAQ